MFLYTIQILDLKNKVAKKAYCGKNRNDNIAKIIAKFVAIFSKLSQFSNINFQT